MENESNRRSMLFLSRFLPAIASTVLAACASLPTPVVYGEPKFEGMSALVGQEPSGRPLHLLIVHGMGTPQPYAFESFIATLAGRLGLVQLPPTVVEPQPLGCHSETPAAEALAHPAPHLIPIEGVPVDASARLYNYDFARPGADRPALTVSFLLWTPLTESVKCGLSSEDNEAPPKQAFAAIAKDFIDDKLGDAVLYGGTYRETVMRPSVQAALCVMIRGKPSGDGKTCAHGAYDEPTVIITHSLGGFMLMDAIDDELRRESGERSAARKVLENTNFIFMMANQVALLDLTTLNGYPQRLGGPPTSAAVAQRFVKR